ncbi:MAG: Tad domain-containing protein [Dehalococcoidia bacterium]
MVTSVRMRANEASREDGQMVILGAFVMVALVMITAVAIYLGVYSTQRRHLQNMADSAALAGAQELNGTAASEADAIAAAQDYLDKQGTSLESPVEIEVQDDYTAVFVRVHKTPNISFGFGLDDKKISARAKARVAAQNLPGPGVVPIGIQYSSYVNAGNDSIELKDKTMDGVNSNSGLIHVTGDNADQIRDGLKYGSQSPLQPTLNTEPGNKFGQATQNANSGLMVRLARALQHSNGEGGACYTWDDIQPPVDPNAAWPCSPHNATEDDGVQATAVILIPVIVEDFTQFNGNRPINVTPEGDLYILAYFWVDGDKTFENPAAGDWDLNPANPIGAIWGRFIQEAPTQLTVFGNCGQDCGIIDFNPDAIFKVVQLIQ